MWCVCVLLLLLHTVRTHTGFANEHDIVFAPPQQRAQGGANFRVAAVHDIEPSQSRLVRQVDSDLGQRGSRFTVGTATATAGRYQFLAGLCRCWWFQSEIGHERGANVQSRGIGRQDVAFEQHIPGVVRVRGRGGNRAAIAIDTASFLIIEQCQKNVVRRDNGALHGIGQFARALQRVLCGGTKGSIVVWLVLFGQEPTARRVRLGHVETGQCRFDAAPRNAVTGQCIGQGCRFRMIDTAGQDQRWFHTGQSKLCRLLLGRHEAGNALFRHAFKDMQSRKR
jgi:hypothetical protein